MNTELTKVAPDGRSFKGRYQRQLDRMHAYNELLKDLEIELI